METNDTLHPNKYAPEDALSDAAVARGRVMQQTYRDLPEPIYVWLSAVLPLIAVSFAVDGWISFALPLVVIAVSTVITVRIANEQERRGVGLGMAVSWQRMPWFFVGLGALFLVTLAMMPLTDIYDWPRWYIVVVGSITGVLSYLLTLLARRRAKKLLADTTQQSLTHP